MTSHVVLNQQFLFCTFLDITSELDEIELSIKRPTGLFFHALSDEAIWLPMSFKLQCSLICLALLHYLFCLTPDDFTCQEESLPEITVG
jgi:hypothetical protein